MKLVRRLTFYILLAVGVVFAADTVLSVRSHLALFDEDTRSDEKVLGDALARAVERVWRRQGEAEAIDLLKSIGAASPEVRISLVYLDDVRGQPLSPEVP